jgi:hypothetical protein
MRLRPCLTVLATLPVLLWLLATAGCTTPEAIKSLSTSVITNQPALAGQYSADLKRFQDFHLLMGRSLDELAGDALGQQAALRVVVRQILLERVQSTRSNLLARFDQLALQVVAKDFPAEIDLHFRPRISEQDAVYYAEFQAARELVLRNPGSAPAQRAHGKAIYTLAEFRRLALEAELTQHSNLLQRIQQCRGEIVQLLDGAFAKYVVTGQPGASLTNLIQTAQEGRKSTAFLTQMTTNIFVYQEQLLAVEKYQNKLGLALAQLDEYLRTDGYAGTRLKYFMAGVLDALKDQASLGKDLSATNSAPDLSKLLGKFGVGDVLQQITEAEKDIPKSAEDVAKAEDGVIAKLKDFLGQGAGQKLSELLRGSPGAGADPAAGTK